MTQVSKPSFIFVVCQVGAEAALKKEVARDYPEFKFAYSRPGFVTFKLEGKHEGRPLKSDFELRLVFARAYGLSVEKLGKSESAESKAQKVSDFLVQNQISCLHLWERDQYLPGDEPLGFKAGQWLDAAQAILQRELKKQKKENEIQINSMPKMGETVADLVLVENEEWWLGIHQHTSDHSPYPGGNPRVSLHPDAPSRAYVKLEEGLIWSGAPLQRGDVAVEVGSAPGGASFALLRRGLTVVGVDPGKMDPIVMKHPKFQHVQKPVAALFREDMPASVEWLLLDMNVTPAVSLYAVDRLATRHLKDSLLGLLLTVKLNQWKLADEIPSMLEHVRSMGMVKIKCTQLPNNRQEIFIAALTRKGALRKSK